MSPPAALFVFDYVDPVSFALDRELRALERSGEVGVRRLGLEIRPAPHPVARGGDPDVRASFDRVQGWAEAAGLTLVRPRIVPWSGKAHELTAHAAATGQEDAARAAIFDAFFLEGRDIGRVDVLVELAAGLGLDRSHTKAVLDVDRYTEEVGAAGREAAAAGVDAPPALVRDGRVLRGFHNADALRTFLLSDA